DEFEEPARSAVDDSKWRFDTGGSGWGNAELEFYTDRLDNAHLDGAGNLSIIALEEDYGGKSYTSARIKTQGKFEQEHGRFEARAKMPTGRGLWPAFWLLG